MIESFQPEHADYLHDESRLEGHADDIVFPHSTEEVASALSEAHAKNMPVTIQGARTGISGGAVPRGGLILNLSKMNRISPLSNDRMQVQPGATLDTIRNAVPPDRFFAPDPTEPTASIGGMMSCNASGALSFHYGPTRNHVKALTVVLPDGDPLELRRGRDRADGMQFTLGNLSGTLPALPRIEVKNAAGYFVRPGMDLLDLFIGAEGTLGIITNAELRLLPMPGAVWGLMGFLSSDAAVVQFVKALRRNVPTDQPVALEYFDPFAMDFLHRHAEQLAARDISVPELPPGSACVYAEWHAPDEAAAETAVMAAAEHLAEAGGDPDAAILADHPAEIERLKQFRHSLPELVNATIGERRAGDPDLTKLGTDMSVPDDRLADVMALYAAGLMRTGLEHVTFGHIGANHLHVNILPRSMDEYRTGKALYMEWADSIIGWNGSISAEHGIGKLKRELFRRMIGDEALHRMQELKKQLDPGLLLNPGNLWDTAAS